MGFPGNSLSKSLSISNIAGYAELPHAYVVMLERKHPLWFVIISCVCCVFSYVCFSFISPMFDEIPIKGLRHLSQSTDSLNRSNQVTESMESLTDEGPDPLSSHC